jgi:hypothetical protein
MKRVIRHLLLLFAFGTTCLRCYSGGPIESNAYLLPSITIGYTFGSGFNYGIDFKVGILKVTYNNPQVNAGVMFSYYWVNFKESQHRIRTINLILDSDVFSVAGGAGDVTRRWGRNNINSAKAFGTSFSFSISTVFQQTPWVGICVFKPKGDTWEFYDKHAYYSFYTFFRQTPYKPFN